MQNLTERLHAATELMPAEIEEAVEKLISPDVENSTKAGFLRGLREKGETAAEIAGFAEAMLRRAVDPEIDPAQMPGPLIDVCGTGGDRSDLFNVSTTCMFVVAAAGAVVVKHGNRAITSQSGGADVLEELGVRIDLPAPELRRSLEEIGAGFLFAPAYHPAFKAIVPVRKQLAAEGVATIFNVLGPLLNPARPAHQLVGIFSRELLPRYAESLNLLGRHRVWAVHGAGLDELSTAGENDIEERFEHYDRRFEFDPQEFGFPRVNLDELKGGGRTENAAILQGILHGEIHGPKRELVVLNSGAALYVAGLALDLPTGFAMAREQLDSSRAAEKLRALQQFHV